MRVLKFKFLSCGYHLDRVHLEDEHIYDLSVELLDDCEILTSRWYVSKFWEDGDVGKNSKIYQYYVNMDSNEFKECIIENESLSTARPDVVGIGLKVVYMAYKMSMDLNRDVTIGILIDEE